MWCDVMVVLCDVMVMWCMLWWCGDFNELLFLSVVFHVATLMPTVPTNLQCKKLHIANDYVVIVYNNSTRPYSFGTIKVYTPSTHAHHYTIPTCTPSPHTHHHHMHTITTCPPPPHAHHHHMHTTTTCTPPPYHHIWPLLTGTV